MGKLVTAAVAQYIQAGTQDDVLPLGREPAGGARFAHGMITVGPNAGELASRTTGLSAPST